MVMSLRERKFFRDQMREDTLWRGDKRGVGTHMVRELHRRSIRQRRKKGCIRRGDIEGVRTGDTYIVGTYTEK